MLRKSLEQLLTSHIISLSSVIDNLSTLIETFQPQPHIYCILDNSIFLSCRLNSFNEGVSFTILLSEFQGFETNEGPITTTDMSEAKNVRLEMPVQIQKWQFSLFSSMAGLELAADWGLEWAIQHQPLWHLRRTETNCFYLILFLRERSQSQSDPWLARVAALFKLGLMTYPYTHFSFIQESFML